MESTSINGLIVRYLILITVAVILTSCSSTSPLNEIKDIDYTLELAMDFYDVGIQNIEENDWVSAEDNLEKAIEVLSKITQIDPNPNDSVAILSQQLFDDILEVLEEVYLKSTEAIVVDPEFVFPEVESVEEENIFLGTEDFIRDSIDFSVFDMPIVINERVMQEIRYLSTKVPSFMVGSLGRMTRYETMIKEKLRENNMPTDIIFQSLIESGFKVKAYSTASASGIWQFIGATGRRYGLKSDYWFDGRRNPERATDAAIKYLTRLQNEFGDWYLSFAAYNCGESRVRRLIKKHGTRDYWKLPLPRETKKYVPRIIAAAIIGHYPEKFGITEIEQHEDVETETVTVRHCISLEVAAKMINVADTVMQQINPEIKRWCTPPNVRSYDLRVPKGMSQQFNDAYAKMDKSKLVKWVRHRVSWGENLGTIAKKYGITVSALKSSNNIHGSKIWARQMLIIPLSASKYDKVAKVSGKKFQEKIQAESDPDVEGVGSYSTYRVRSGDNLYNIAQKFGISLQNLLSWNRLTLKSVLYVGQKIKLYGVDDIESRVHAPEGKYVVHSVHSGESLYLISKKYNVSLSTIKSLNNMGNSRIYPGQKLKIKTATTVRVGEVKSSLESVQDPSKKRFDHRVKGGESIYLIAQRYDVSVSDIRDWNDMSGSKIFPGQKLVIYSVAGSQKESGSTHVVKSGESLWSISQKYGTSIQRLKILNNIGNRINPGMKLKIK